MHWTKKKENKHVLSSAGVSIGQKTGFFAPICKNLLYILSRSKLSQENWNIANFRTAIFPIPKCFCDSHLSVLKSLEKQTLPSLTSSCCRCLTFGDVPLSFYRHEPSGRYFSTVCNLIMTQVIKERCVCSCFLGLRKRLFILSQAIPAFRSPLQHSHSSLCCVWFQAPCKLSRILTGCWF